MVKVYEASLHCKAYREQGYKGKNVRTFFTYALKFGELPERPKGAPC